MKKNQYAIKAARAIIVVILLLISSMAKAQNVDEEATSEVKEETRFYSLGFNYNLFLQEYKKHTSLHNVETTRQGEGLFTTGSFLDFGYQKNSIQYGLTMGRIRTDLLEYDYGKWRDPNDPSLTKTWNASTYGIQFYLPHIKYSFYRDNDYLLTAGMYGGLVEISQKSDESHSFSKTEYAPGAGVLFRPGIYLGERMAVVCNLGYFYFPLKRVNLAGFTFGFGLQGEW